MKKSEKKIIRQLAAEFNKDPRTIKKWLADKSNELFHTHPATIRILKEGK
jgi:hypothetical protein